MISIFFLLSSGAAKGQIAMKLQEEKCFLSFVFQYKHLNETYDTTSPRETLKPQRQRQANSIHVLLATFDHHLFVVS